MWAPDCVEKDGKYYFYFPNGPKSGRGFAIGVATADRPEGPFRLEQEPIKGVSGIDPCVLVDRDGSAYIYWSGMGIRGARLKNNMKEVEGELQEVKMPRREGAPEMPPMKVAGQQMEGLPDGFKEGPFAFRRGDWYYLTFPWVRGETGEGKNPTETLAYAMSKNPLGPWDFKGIIMAEHENRCWTNHHSLVEYKGQWYLFYHHNDLSPRDDKRRSVCIDRVSFNVDGTIREVKPTMRGVGINKATEQIETDRYSTASDGTTTAYVDTTNYMRGLCATLPKKGSWLRYNDVDFSVLNVAYVIVKAKASDNTEFCIREKSASGKVIAQHVVRQHAEVIRHCERIVREKRRHSKPCIGRQDRQLHIQLGSALGVILHTVEQILPHFIAQRIGNNDDCALFCVRHIPAEEITLQGDLTHRTALLNALIPLRKKL
jgi:hypothetical protein